MISIERVLLDTRGDNDKDALSVFENNKSSEYIVKQVFLNAQYGVLRHKILLNPVCQLATCNSRDATDVKSTEVENLCAENSKKGF